MGETSAGCASSQATPAVNATTDDTNARFIIDAPLSLESFAGKPAPLRPPVLHGDVRRLSSETRASGVLTGWPGGVLVSETRRSGLGARRWALGRVGHPFTVIHQLIARASIVVSRGADRLGRQPGTPAPPARGAAHVDGLRLRDQAYGSDAGALPRIVEEAFDEVDRIDRLMSHYKPESPLSHVNREAARQSGATSRAELFDFIAEPRCATTVSPTAPSTSR